MHQNEKTYVQGTESVRKTMFKVFKFAALWRFYAHPRRRCIVSLFDLSYSLLMLALDDEFSLQNFLLVQTDLILR